MVENQAYLFLVFSLTGVIIGILFDIFRVLRKSFKTSNLITYIEDILFWVLTGLLILYNIWYFNDGEIRIFMFLGIIIGGLIYILTLSNLFINILVFLINKTKKITKLIIIPFKPIYRFCRNRYIDIKKFLNKIANNGKIFTNFEKKRGNLEKKEE